MSSYEGKYEKMAPREDGSQSPDGLIKAKHIMY